MTESELAVELEELCTLAEQELTLTTTRVAHIRALSLVNRLRRLQARVSGEA